MCGRFTLALDRESISEAFPRFTPPEQVTPRYNVAPSQPVAVVTNNSHNQIKYLQWGLIPSWAKDPKIGNRMINARGETLASKPSFRVAYRRRRCLILADGFYEWQRVLGRKAKIPTYIRMADDRAFAFGGLWETWFSGDGTHVVTCTIITTTPNSLMEKIHNRMPVIIPREDYDAWLDPEDRSPEEMDVFIKSYPAELMRAYPVSTMVNNSKTDTPELIIPAN